MMTRRRELPYPGSVPLIVMFWLSGVGASEGPDTQPAGGLAGEWSLAWHISQSVKDRTRRVRIELPSPGVCEVRTDFTVAENVTLAIPREVVLNIGQKATLTINGGIEAGSYQIFE